MDKMIAACNEWCERNGKPPAFRPNQKWSELSEGNRGLWLERLSKPKGRRKKPAVINRLDIQMTVSFPKWPRKKLPATFKKDWEKVEYKRQTIIDDLAVMLSGNKKNALHLMGPASSGKSYIITNFLTEYYNEPPNMPGGSWTYDKGNITPGGLLGYCRANADKTLVFDDVLRFFKDERARDYLLNLTDTGTNRLIKDIRHVKKSKEHPDGIDDQSFLFSGKIITIANVKMGGDLVRNALKSRAIQCTLEFTPAEMEAGLTHIACGGYEHLSPDECLKVLADVQKVCKEEDWQITFQDFVDDALQQYAAYQKGIGAKTNWLDRFRDRIRVEREDAAKTNKPLTNDDKREIMEEIAIEAHKRFSKRQQAQEALEYWYAETEKRLQGDRKAKGMYYNTLKRLKAEGRLKD